MKDKIEIKVSPRRSREPNQFSGQIIKIPGLKLSVDDILVVGFQKTNSVIPKEAVGEWPASAGLDPATETVFTKTQIPLIWTKSKFYSGATQNLGVANPIGFSIEKSIETGGNPMLNNGSPLWDHVTPDEGANESYRFAYNIYEECVDAVLSEPGTGVSSVQNFWSSNTEQVTIQKC